MALYEQLIFDGVTEAFARRSAIDHVTARRVAIWLLPRSQADPDFMRGLVRFAQTGAVSTKFKQILQRKGRAYRNPDRAQAAWLHEYAVARGPDLGPVSEDFAAICDQIDRADAMLNDLRNRVRESRSQPPPHSRRQSAASQERKENQLVALARLDPESGTVGLILDAATANAAIHAISVGASDGEARAREVDLYGEKFPEGSYGRRQRDAVSARQTRVTARLRAVERAYRDAMELGPTLAPDLPSGQSDVARIPNRDLEAE